MDYQAPKGVFDILPEYAFENPDFRCVAYWEYVEKTFKKTAALYGFSEIRTPIFEHTDLFTRSTGETSDIVSKEMYTFNDKGDRSLSLRPEGTAPVARAAIEHHLLHKRGTHKLYYLGPFFRYERPQAGRYRQLHQLGIEVIGIKEAEIDAEIIAMLMHFYHALGLKNLTLLINSLGDEESRKAYQEAFYNYLLPHKEKLSTDSQNRLEKNPLRILDSKDKGDQLILESAPSLSDFLSDESKKHFETVCKTLTFLNIPFVIHDKLVRGLDYYNKTVFEIVTQDLGAQNTLGGGGRYDGLIKKLGGPDVPTFGFGTGIERIILTMIQQHCLIPNAPAIDVLFLPICEEAKTHSIVYANALRNHGLKVDINLKMQKIQKSLQSASEQKIPFVIILGEDELLNKRAKIKVMDKKEEIDVALDELSHQTITLSNAR